MKNLRSHNKVNASGGMSSMTDLVFLLLIFFIILSTQIRELPGHEVDLPTSSKSSSTPTGTTVVAVSAENQYYIGDAKDPIAPENLEMEILKGITSSEDSIVELFGDKACDWSYAVEVINIVKKHKCKLVIKTKKS